MKENTQNAIDKNNNASEQKEVINSINSMLEQIANIQELKKIHKYIQIVCIHKIL